MTKRFIVNTVIPSMAVLIFVSGVAQAQSLSVASPKPIVAEAVAEPGSAGIVGAEFLDPNRFLATVCTVGPRTGDVLFKCSGIGFTNANPTLVLCQTRNPAEEFINYPDQFACQVIGTALNDNGSVWVKIRRIDDGTASSAWGQNLKINLLVVR